MKKAFCECGHELKADIDGRRFLLCLVCAPKLAVGDRVLFSTPGIRREAAVLEVSDDSETYRVSRPDDDGWDAALPCELFPVNGGEQHG